MLILQLKWGDEILNTNHEYGVGDYTWDFTYEKTGAKYIHQHMPPPIHFREEIVEQFWQGITPRTKVIYRSQIISSTAVAGR